ncbi:MAG: hypothetical protein LC723_06405 [Actinobacteria bacterium]|nr:hypothetical protein [Actinomycetota bacterium]
MAPRIRINVWQTFNGWHYALYLYKKAGFYEEKPLAQGRDYPTRKSAQQAATRVKKELTK